MTAETTMGPDCSASGSVHCPLDRELREFARHKNGLHSNGWAEALFSLRVAPIVRWTADRHACCKAIWALQ
jgi:hypothetical protein